MRRTMIVAAMVLAGFGAFAAGRRSVTTVGEILGQNGAHLRFVLFEAENGVRGVGINASDKHSINTVTLIVTAADLDELSRLAAETKSEMLNP